jgi:glutamine---fructose-6-phosphate transaminase (isomerizing)
MTLTARPTQMHAEAGEASVVVASQYRSNEPLVRELAQRLRAANPSILFTCARGSSDHAATYAKYLFETRLRIPTVSQAPSMASIYGAPLLHMSGQPFLLISQSGKSPDLILSAEAARKAGAIVIALVNDLASPLAEVAEFVVPLHAGPETSVAATKSFIAALSALAHLAAAWAEDAELMAALSQLPTELTAAWECDWAAALPALLPAASLFTLGRGLTLGIAQEAALKFKETSGIHAEAFSIAEVAHGPMALAKPGFPLLIFPPLDAARQGLDAIIQRLADRGAVPLIAGETSCLPLPSTLHPVTGPIAMVQAFYGLVNAVSLARGHDPDHPPLLSKVTETR